MSLRGAERRGNLKLTEGLFHPAKAGFAMTLNRILIKLICDCEEKGNEAIQKIDKSVRISIWERKNHEMDRGQSNIRFR